ncbi:MAG: hypothetical protein J7L56_03430 [Halomonas sp.]|nr:hypothetical protein [Halomonas sp.]MCD6437303.1 hypothetical protein [Halomonas sp.]
MRRQRMTYSDYVVDGINRVAVALSALRRIPVELRLALAREGLWHDISQAAITAAYDPDVPNNPRAIYNAAQREIYNDLRALGWHRLSATQKQKGMRGSFYYPFVILGEGTELEDIEAGVVRQVSGGRKSAEINRKY